MFVERFEEQGCLVIDRLFDPGLIDLVRLEYQAQYQSFDPNSLPLHMNVGDKRLHLPLQIRGALLEAQLYANPLLMGILSQILPTTYLIDNVNCVTALPGAEAQHIHRDHPVLFAERAEAAASIPPFAVTVAIPLVDLDAATGTTKLYAGSVCSTGTAEKGPVEFSDEIFPFLRRGGCFIMDYRLWHCGMANRSQRERPILYIVYAREWFTDVINFKKHSRLPIDIEDIAKIPDQNRRLFRRVAAKGLHDISIKELMANNRDYRSP